MGLSPEYENAKNRVQALREEYTLLLSQYAELTGAARANLDTLHMLQLGKKEYRLFSLKIEILLIKREISLLQAAVNRMEKK